MNVYGNLKEYGEKCEQGETSQKERERGGELKKWSGSGSGAGSGGLVRVGIRRAEKERKVEVKRGLNTKCGGGNDSDGGDS